MNTDNPYTPSEAIFSASPSAPATGIRKAWAVFLALCIVSFFFATYTAVFPSGKLLLITIVSVTVDLAGIVFLFGFVIRKPISSMTIRVLVLGLALLMCLRALYVLYILVPGLLPWTGRDYQLEALGGVAIGVPATLLLALAMWRYATQAQGRRTPPTDAS